MKRTLGGLRCAVVLLPLYWLTIFIGTHLPPKRLLQIRANDKLLHFTAFFGLCFLLCWAISTNKEKRFKNVIIALAICVIYAIFDELSQIPIGRSAEVLDFLADVSGALTGAVVYSLLRAALVTYRSHISTTPNAGSVSATIDSNS